jgi:hypothetical protein
VDRVSESTSLKGWAMSAPISKHLAIACAYVNPTLDSKDFMQMPREEYHPSKQTTKTVFKNFHDTFIL